MLSTWWIFLSGELRCWKFTESHSFLNLVAWEDTTKICFHSSCFLKAKWMRTFPSIPKGLGITPNPISELLRALQWNLGKLAYISQGEGNSWNTNFLCIQVLGRKWIPMLHFKLCWGKWPSVVLIFTHPVSGVRMSSSPSLLKIWTYCFSKQVHWDKAEKKL